MNEVTGFPMFDLVRQWQSNYFRALEGIVSPSQQSRALVPTSTRSKGMQNGERVVALGEETFQVDKQVVEGEKTKVHRFVVRKPVSADVKLVNKTVTIQRRTPVDASKTGDILHDETIEVRDTTEIPVIVKGVRVREEVVIREEETTHVQTVRDTVQHDEVRIEQPTRQLVPVKGGKNKESSEPASA